MILYYRCRCSVKHQQVMEIWRFHILPPFLYISIPRVQNLCPNISISRDGKKLNRIGGWVESWCVV
jgi:hypothetical protein